MSKVIGIDLGTTNSVRRRPGGRRAHRHPQLRGRAHDSVRRGLHQGRRAARRPGRQAPGRHQPREHDLLDQALHGPPLLRGHRGSQDGPLQGRRRRATATSRVEVRGKQYSPPEISAMILQKLKQAAEDYLGEKVDQGGDHRPGLLQRRAAPGHQGRGQDRRPRGPAHRQRAHGGGAGLRPRQEEGRDDRGLRLRRRHLRHLGAGGRRGRGRGEGHQRRHAPGRRQHRPARHRLDRRRVQEGPGHRPRRRTRWPCSA